MTAPDAAKRWNGYMPPAPSAEPPPALAPAHGQPLTLVELTDIALRNHPQTQHAWAVARAGAAAVGLARAGYLPEITAQLAFSESKSASSSGNPIPRQTRYGPSISLGYLLLDFGTRAAQLQAAEFNLLAANLLHNQALADVILQVEESYYLLLGLQALETANRQTLANANANLDAAKQRRRAGLATIGDVYQAETAAAQAQLALTTTQGQIAAAQGQLANAIAVPISHMPRVQPLQEDTKIAEVGDDVHRLLAQAKTARPQLLAAQAQVQAAAADVKAAAVLGKPTLTLNAGAFQTEIVDQATVDGFNVGLNLRIPLFTGFRALYAQRQAQAVLEQAQADRDLLDNQVDLEVWRAFYNQQTAASTITSAGTAVRSATQAAEVARARYRAGVGTILEVLSTQTAEAETRVQSIQARLNWYIALAQLGHAVGALPAGAGVSASP